MFSQVTSLSLIVALAGCGPASDTREPSGDGKDASATRAEPAVWSAGPETAPAWEVKLDAASQPVVTDGVAVLAVKVRKDELDLVGIEVATGDEVWRTPYSPGPGGVPRGVTARPVLVPSANGPERVVFQRPPEKVDEKSGWELQLVSVDPASGGVVSESGERVRLLRAIEVCPDGHDACSIGDFDGEERRFRYEIETGRIVLEDWPTDELVHPDGAVSKSDLFVTYDDSDWEESTMGRLDADGEVMWERTEAALFGEGVSRVDQFSLEEEAGVFVGTVEPHQPPGGPRWRPGVGPVERDYGEVRSVGVDATTGEVLWTREGVTTSCGWDAAALVKSVSRHSAWCRVAGWTTGEVGDDDHDADVTELALEGFDPATGEVTWSVDLDPGSLEILQRDEDPRPLTAPGRVVTGADGDSLLVDLDTGETYALPDGQVFLCAGWADYSDYGTPHDDAFSGMPELDGDPLAETCTAGGEPTTAPLAEAAVTAGAIDAGGGWYVVATESGLAAYDLT